jgi:hypothetical protein
MRRVLAITLLLAFGSPLVAPLFAATADPQSALPACCRRHGVHHCSMSMSTLTLPSGPALQSPPCPFYPTAGAAPRLAAASLETALPQHTEALRNPAPLPSVNTRRAETFTASANLKRGPPALPA